MGKKKKKKIRKIRLWNGSVLTLPLVLKGLIVLLVVAWFVSVNFELHRCSIATIIALVAVVAAAITVWAMKEKE